MPVKFLRSGQTKRAAGHAMTALLLGAMSVLLVFDAAVQSYFAILFFGDTAFGSCLMVCLLVIFFFAGVALLQKDFFILVLFASIIVFFLSYYLYFIIGANRPLNFNAMGSYYGLLTVVVFYVLAKHNLLPFAIKFLFYVYAAYLLMYSAILFADEGVLATISQKVNFDLTDPGRGSRLIINQIAAPYVLIYSVAKLQEKFRLRYTATFALASFALYLSLSRVIIICSASILLIYLVTRRMTYVQYFSFLTYLLVSGYLIVGVFEPSFNPYGFSKADTSAIARSYEYEFVVPYIRQYPFFGIGIPDASPGLTHYTGAAIYPDDLGTIGILFIFGFFGFSVIAIIGVYFSCMQNFERSSLVLGLTNGRVLSLAGCVIGLYSATNSFLWNGSGIVFSLIIANTLYNSRLFAKGEQASRPVLRHTRFSYLPTSRTERQPDIMPD